MRFKDLRDFIEQVDNLGELRRVEGADWNIEVGAITEVAASSPACSVVLFDKIKEHKPGYRVVTNLLHTERRLALALDESLELRGVELVKKWKELLGRADFGPPPVEVTDGPIQENIRTGGDVNILEFPSVKWHEFDGGRYFAGAVSIMKDPDEGWVNLGVYRLQVQDKSTLSLYTEPRDKDGRVIHRKYWARGESCPIAISLGHAPAMFIAASRDAPWGLSEYKIAGEINGGPIPVLPGAYTKLPVPATAELVFEGEIPPLEVESRDEGPFGEATGYYASGKTTKQPVVKVRCIMHRNDPIIHGAPPMIPTKGRGHFPFQSRCTRIWNDLDKCNIPAIRGVYQHAYGIIVISLKQQYAGHAKQAALVATGSPGSVRARFVIMVDEDIDPYNMEEVLWAMAFRCDPERDVEIIKECWAGSIDPLVPEQDRLSENLTTARVIINACSPVYRRGEFPRDVATGPDVRAAVMEKWPDIIK